MDIDSYLKIIYPDHQVDSYKHSSINCMDGCRFEAAKFSHGKSSLNKHTIVFKQAIGPGVLQMFNTYAVKFYKVSKEFTCRPLIYFTILYNQNIKETTAHSFKVSRILHKA